MNEKEIFKPENKSIRKIFGDTDAFYQMPIYQRPYSWDKERVEQLWYDILEAFKNNQEDKTIDPNYFLGSVVVVKKSDGYEVVDGQQRLTTLTILFCVLRDLNVEVKKKVILSSIRDLVEEKERLKLTTHLNNQASFEETIIKDFIDYLFEQTTMIKIVCFDEGFAIKLFTVLNDRGLDLTPADIIKAYLLQNLDETKRPSFIEVWKRLENTIRHSNESLQGVFNLYLYYLISDNPKRSLQDELKIQFKNGNPQQIILDIEKFAENLIEIQTNKQDKYTSMLKYLSQSIYWKSILASAKHTEYQHFDKLKVLITKYYYQSWIAGGTSNRIKQTSFNILKKVKAKADIFEIEQLIKNNLSKYENYREFLSTDSAYWNKWLKPVLLSVEYFQLEQRDFIPISRELHAEHILPQEWDREELNWNTFFSKDEAWDNLNTLGNLTLLSGHKNIQASNRNFRDKVEIYKGNNGKGFDGKTGFEITKRILDDYPVWNTDNIAHRFAWLQSEIEKIFEIK